MPSLLDQKLYSKKQDKLFDLLYRITTFDPRKDFNYYNPLKEEIEILLDENPSLAFKIDENGYTPLLICLEKEMLELIDILLSYKTNINQKTNENITALDLAVKYKNLYWIKRLIDQGAVVTEKHLERSSGDVLEFLEIHLKQNKSPLVNFLIQNNIGYEKNMLFKWIFDEGFLNCKDLDELVLKISPNKGIEYYKLLKEKLVVNDQLHLEIIFVFYYLSKYYEDQNILKIVLKKNFINLSIYMRIPLKDNLLDFFNKVDKIKIKKFLKKATGEDIFRFLTEDINNYGKLKEMLIDDLDINKMNSFEELHQVLDGLVLNSWYQKDYDLKFPLSVIRLDGLYINDFIIKVPKKTSTLFIWGKRMNNCLADYSKKCFDKKTVVLGIFKNKKLFYNIEIKNKKLTQIEAPKGSTIKEEDKALIYNFLVSHNIIIENKSKNNYKHYMYIFLMTFMLLRIYDLL